jgi:hypothetical protein
MTPATGPFESFLPVTPLRTLVALGSMLARRQGGLPVGGRHDPFPVVNGNT